MIMMIIIVSIFFQIEEDILKSSGITTVEKPHSLNALMEAAILGALMRAAIINPKSIHLVWIFTH